MAKDETKPFRVETGALEIEALGTQFDVNAYRDNGQWMTTLVEGRVRVSVGGTKQTCVLEPGKQALLHNNVLTVSDANVEEITGWKEGFCIPQYDDGEYSPAIGEMVRCGDRFSGCGGALLSLYGCDETLSSIESVN